MKLLDFIRGRNPLETNAQLRKELTDLTGHVIVFQQVVLDQGKRLIALENEPR